MVGKNNKQVLREKQANKFKRYALKKLTVGLASVTIGTGLAFATSSTVSADELAVGERTVVVSDKTAEEQPQPDTPYLQEQEEAVTSAEEPQVTEDRISEEKAVKTSEETDEKATESEEVAEEKQADSHEQTEETSDIEETNTKAPQAPATQLAPVVESVAEPVREEQSAEAPTTTLSQIDQLPEEFLTYLRDHSDIVDFKNAATIETYANLLQQSYGVEAAKEERIRAIEAAVKEIETTKEQAKNDVVDQTERLIDADKDSTTPQDQSKETFKKAIQQAANPQTVVESYLKDAGYKAEDIAGILANVDMSLANNPDQLLDNIVQAGIKYANEHTQPGVLLANPQGRDVGHLISSRSAVEGRGVIKQSQNDEGGRWFDVQARVTIDNTGDTIKAGDYFDVKYNLTSVQHLNPNENTGGEAPYVRDNEGNIVAFISDDRENGIIRYTLTSVVEESSLVEFILNYRHHVDRAKVKTSGQYDVSYTFGNQKHELKNVTIQYPRETSQSGDARRHNLNLKSGLTHVTDNKTYQHVTYVNPLGRQIYNGSFALFTIAPGTLDSKDATIKVYRVKDPARLSESMVGNNFNDRTIFEDVTNKPAFANLKKTRKVNDTTMVTNFVNLGTFSDTYAVVVDSKNTLEDGERLNEAGGLGSGLQLSGTERANSPTITVNTSDFTTVSSQGSAAATIPRTKIYSIGDKVWEDINHDGLQSRNEPGIPNVEVQLLDHKGEIIRTTRTDNDGNYLFENLSSGQYFVQFKTPDGFVPTIKNVNNDQNDTMDSDGLVVPVEINNSNNMTIDSGFYRKVYSIGDKVWVDSDKNGIQDRGERGLANVTVKLVDEFGNVKTTNTNQNGEYRFDNLDEGTYQVIFQTPEGYEPTKPYQGDDRGQDSNAATTTIKVSPENPHFNEDRHNPTIDFGLVEVQPEVAEPERKVYSIGDKVWVDSNKDGVQDRGEQGLANVTVKLVDEFGNVQTTTTNRNGEYRFDNLDEGTYQVIFQTPEGYEATKPYQGNNRNQDSNAATTTIKVSPQNPHFNSNGHNSTIDFGLVEVQPQKLYEMTVEDSSFETHIYFEEEYNKLPDKTPQTVEAGKIKKVQSGKDRRVQVLYEHVNPDTLPQSTTDQFVDGFVNGKLVTEAGTFVQRNGQYWREVSRQVLQEYQDEIFIYKPVSQQSPITPTFEINNDGHLIAKVEGEDSPRDLGKVKGEPGNPGKDGRDGLSPKVTVEENATDNDGNTGTRITVTPQIRNESGEIVDGTPEVSFIRDGKDGAAGEDGADGTDGQDGKDGLSPKVTVEENATDEEGNKGTRITVTPQIRNESGEIVDGTPEVSFIRDGKDGVDGQDGKDGLSPKVTVEENATDEEGNKGTRITVTPQIRNESGEIVDGTPEVSFIRDGKDGVDGQDGKDGLSPKVTVEENTTDNDGNTGTRITVTPQIRNESGEIVDGTPEVSFIRDGKDGAAGEDGADGRDGLSPKVTVEENATDEEGNKGTRITVTPQIRNESGEIVDGTPEVSFIRDGKDGVDGQDGTDGTDGQDGKDGLSPKVTVEENATDNDGNTGTRITVTPQIRNESGEIVDGTPEVSFIRDGKDGVDGQDGTDGTDGQDGKDGLSPKVTVEENATDDDGNTGTRITVTPQIRNESGEIVDGTPEVSFIRDGKDGAAGEDGADGRDGLSPKVTVEENATDNDGNTGTRITVTPQIRNESGEIVDGTPEVSFIRDGKDGKSITVERTETDGDGNTVVYFSDGSKVTIAKGDKGDRGEKGEPGKDGKTPTVETSNVFDSEGNAIGTRIIVRDGEGNKVGDQFISNGKNGKDGQSITASVERGEQNGRPGTYVIIRNEDGTEIDREFIFDGEKGKDGKDGNSVTASVERGEQNGRPGTYVIIRNEDGTEIDREFIFDGENGQTPTIESSNVLDADGQTVGTRIIIRDGNGRIVGDQIIRNGKDGKNGQDGKDGETPTIGSNGNWFIAGKDTGVKAKGEDGQSITITKETRDADGNTIVHFSDGSTVTISKGDKGDQGQKGDKGERGQTPNVSQTPIRDQNGRIVGYTLTFTDPVTGEKIGNSIDVYNGTDGKDGKSVTASVERGEQNGRPGSYIIIRNEDGVELDREFVFDGEDGTTPKVSVQTIERNDGRKTHVVTITNPKTGETQTFTVTDGEKGQPGQAGKDGRDGKNGFTPTIGSNGNWFIAGQDTGVKAKGEDGQSITVTKEVKDEQGNTVVHFSDGSTITISKGDRGETGPAGKDGRDGRDGRDGKDGKDLTGNNGNINIENSNNQSQDQNQTQNQNSNQVVTNNTYNFGDVSLTINQTLNLNGEVVLTKIIVKDKDGLTNETQIDKNTQINQLNVFVNNGQVLVGTFNLTNQNNVKQLLVGNLIINLVINNDSADNPTVPKKPEQPETTPERPSETPDNTPEQPNETPNVPSTPGQPGETPEAPGTNETPDNTPEQPNETPNVPSTPGQPGETPEAPGTNETPDNTPEQPNETPNVPSTPGQPGETPEAPGTNETPDNTPEQPNETPNVPSTPGQPGETPEAPGTNETPDNTPEQPNETPEVPSTPEETPGTPGQPGETPEAPGTNETPDNTPEQPNETPNTPTQLSNTSAQPDRSSITGERLPETATDSWMLALASLVSLSSGAVLAVKKKKDDE